MAARRRVESAEIRLGPALKALAACLLIGGAAVAYVRQQHELFVLREQEASANRALSQLHGQIADMVIQSNALVGQLELQSKELRGDLGPTRAGQVVTLTVPAAWADPDPRSVKLAGGGDR